MLDFVIFAITFAVVLVAFVFYLYPGSRRVTTIPGMDLSDAKEGNIPDIIKAGGLHKFLVDLHADHGAIASFWFGEQLVVSLASPELFREHVKVFDRPPILFKEFEQLIGVNSIQYANGADGRKRKKDYEKFFNHVACDNYYGMLSQVGQAFTKKLSSLPKGQHIPLHQYMMALALKSILLCAFGTEFEDEKKIVSFFRLYETVFSELSARSSESITRDDPRQQRLNEDIGKMQSMVREVIESRKASKKPEITFVDFILENEIPKEVIESDAMTFLVGGFHTTGNLLTWALFFVSSHDEVQECLFQELKEVLNGELVSPDNINELKYMRQVIDESLRCRIVAPYAARYQNIHVKIGGHIIPKGTPVIHALGVVLTDPKLWPEPNKFDPDRFSPENMKNIPKLSFSPFGFAGQRICPGQKFAYLEATFYLALICSNFKLHFIEGQVVNPVNDFVTHPEEEIWITVTPR